MILNRSIDFRHLAQTLAVGLVVLAMAFLVACGDGDDTQTTEAPQPTATSAGASTSAQPTQEAPQPTAVPTSADVATPSPSDSAAEKKTPAPSGPKIQVVTTTNFLADWARVVGGDRVEVFSLLPVGGDPHTFLPGARDVAKVADADIVLTVGLELEAGWLEDLLRNASADESKIVALGESVDPIEFGVAAMHDDHEDEHGHKDEDEMTTGRLLVSDALEAHLSVIDLSTEEIDRGLFEIAAPRATVRPSPSHRFGVVLARGPEEDDDRIHIFDGGIFLALHDDHYDLVKEPVSRHSLEIAEEAPIHYVNSHGWTAIFADTHGHVILINEEALATSRGDYEPIVLEAGPQHGAAIVVSDDHVIVTSNNPDYPDNSDDSLPVGAEVRTFDDEVVYDASNRSCPGMHGEAHNEHGVALGCDGGVLFIHAHDGEYEHEFIANPPEMREGSRIGSVYGHDHVEHFFGKAFYFDGQDFVDDGIWLIDAARAEMWQVFSEPSTNSAFSSDGEVFYVLGSDGVLHALDAHDGDLIETMELVGPGEAGNPAFIVVGEMLYVADPNSGHVLGVHLEHMEIEEEWEVGGAPSSLAFVGVTESQDEGHGDHEDEHGHEDEDEHGHEDEDEHGHEDEDEHGHEDEDEHGHEDEDEHGHEDEDEHGHEDEDKHGHEDEHGHHHGTLDPHFWFDPIKVKIAINEIAARLSAIDPDNSSVYLQNASEYGEQLDELHAWIQEQVSAVEPQRRLLVTSHDSLSYFAAAYGFRVVGLVIPSLATHVEPSAEHIADLVDVIREHEVPAVFGETTVSERLAQAVARETGADLVQLYSGSLGEEGSGADTYLGMVRTNVERIVGALR